MIVGIVGTAAVEHKDVVLALLGASAGLAGLVLVFLGFVVGAIGGFDPGTSSEVLAPYRHTVALVAAVFVIGIVAVALATGWLVLVHPPNALYVGVIFAFAVQLLALVISTGVVLKRVAWQ